jgi:hypothetical protein
MRSLDGVVVGVAVLAEPEAEEFLVDHLGFATCGEAGGVRIGDPVAGAVGGVEFVDEEDFAGGGEAELVFGVDEDEAALAGELLAEGEELEGLAGGEVPLGGGEPVFGEDASGGDGAVMGGFFGGGGDEVAGEGIVLAHGCGQSDAAEVALAGLVLGVDGGVCGTGEVAADDELDGEDAAFAGDEGVGVGARDDVVRHDVRGLREPVEGGAVEHLAFAGDAAEVAVEAGLAVGGDEEQVAAGVSGSEVVGVADLAGVFVGEGEVGFGEGVRDGGEEVLAGHGDSRFEMRGCGVADARTGVRGGWRVRGWGRIRCGRVPRRGGGGSF